MRQPLARRNQQGGARHPYQTTRQLPENQATHHINEKRKQMNIPQEAVEAAAKSLYEVPFPYGGPRFTWEEATVAYKLVYRRLATACLEKALPATVLGLVPNIKGGQEG